MRVSERRKYPREECFIAVNFAFDDKAYTDFIRNISKNGIYIESKEQVPRGRAIVLAYHPPKQRPTKRIGKIVRSNLSGMGVRFPKGGAF